MKFLEIFNKIQKGNYALTDESIYYSLKNNDELIPLYGGNKQHVTTERKISVSAKTKKGMPITIFSGEGIIISLDGSAGSMTYKNNEKFALNHHAGFITIKTDKKNIVNLEYFSLFFQDFYRNLSVSDGSKTLSLNQIYLEEFDLPPFDIQTEIMKTVFNSKKTIGRLINIKKKYQSLLSKYVFINDTKLEIKLNKILKYCSRNDNLDEFGIYNHSTQTNDIQVLSGADILCYGRVDSTTINIHYLKDKQCLHVVSRGNAGKLTYLSKGTYATNTNAFLLYLTDDYKKVKNINTDKKEEYILKFLLYYLQPIFYEVSSHSDLGVFPLTNVFNNLMIPDFTYNKDMIDFVDIHEKAFHQIKSIQSIEYRYSELLNKVIYFN